MPIVPNTQPAILSAFSAYFCINVVGGIGPIIQPSLEGHVQRQSLGRFPAGFLQEGPHSLWQLLHPVLNSCGVTTRCITTWCNQTV